MSKNVLFLKSVAKKGVQLIFRVDKTKKLARNIFLKKILEFPQLVQPEITNVCNANCIMCPQSEMTRKVGEMDFDLYKKIIDECSRNRGRVKTILPFLNGEPFLHPRLKDYISYAKEKNKKAEVSIFTNASLLDERRSLEVLNSGLDKMHISFDGCTKETYEKVRRNLDFDVVTNNVLRFFQLRKRLNKRKPEVNLGIIEMKETRDEVQKFVDKWKSLANSVTIESYSNWGGKIPRKNEEEREQSKRRYPCPRLWLHFVALRNGDVAICCLDYDGKFLLGNVQKNSIREVWHGEVIKKYRSFHLQGRYDKIPICENCNSWRMEPPLWWW